MRVDLGRREALVPQQLLDDAQVGAALEQVRGEAVAERVRAHALGQAGLAPQPVEAPAQAADTERRAEVVEKYRRRLLAAGRRTPQEHRPALVEVRLERVARRRPEQPDPLLAALAQHPQLPASQVERTEVRGRELADP